MFVKLVRLGDDAKRIEGSKGNFVSLSVAYDYRQGGDDKTQWIDLTFNGARAEAAVDHLKKGTGIVATIDNLHVHEYERKDGTKGASLRGQLVSFDFAGGNKKASGDAGDEPPI